ncbi:MAG: hypothetical protein GY717_15975 [Rhodobacteraceae bacterium]|nr:hypothetical protein [Paracoccaceae bacterium]
MRMAMFFVVGLTLTTLASAGVMADTGVMGGWAADRADCRYVNTTQGVTQNVTAGILTPENVYFYGGECRVTGLFPGPEGITFKGVCDEGDGPYSETLQARQVEPDKMRAKWPDIGWTSFYRCWDLPAQY